jgi:hypothetical protein
VIHAEFVFFEEVVQVTALAQYVEHYSEVEHYGHELVELES